MKEVVNYLEVGRPVVAWQTLACWSNKATLFTRKTAFRLKLNPLLENYLHLLKAAQQFIFHVLHQHGGNERFARTSPQIDNYVLLFCLFQQFLLHRLMFQNSKENTRNSTWYGRADKLSLEPWIESPPPPLSSQRWLDPIPFYLRQISFHLHKIYFLLRIVLTGWRTLQSDKEMPRRTWTQCWKFT